LLGELIDGIDAARGMHPARMAVEALIDEELPPGRSSIGIETFIARNLLLRAEVPARVRIDEKERTAACGDRRCNRDAVRTLALGPRRERSGDRFSRIERLQLVKVDALDV